MCVCVCGSCICEWCAIWYVHVTSCYLYERLREREREHLQLFRVNKIQWHINIVNKMSFITTLASDMHVILWCAQCWCNVGVSCMKATSGTKRALRFHSFYPFPCHRMCIAGVSSWKERRCLVKRLGEREGFSLRNMLQCMQKAELLCDVLWERGKHFVTDVLRARV